jgi:hypothetical protein
MALFLRSFVRKRLISLATTASVAATSFALAEDPTRTDHVRGTMPIQHVASRPDISQEQPFLLENNDAMNRMMADMEVKPARESNRDLVSVMVPHQRGAIDMREGWPAEEIVATQQQKIVPTRTAVSERLSSAAQSPEQHVAEMAPQSAWFDGPATRGRTEMFQ